MSKESSLERRIIDEIREKVGDYESQMSAVLAEVGEATALYEVRKPSKKPNTFSNPRLTEHYRACNALSTMMYRMMTAQDVPFEPVPVSMDADYNSLFRIKSTLAAQDRAAGYKRALYKACSFVVPFGTVICQEDYQTVGVSSYGRRLPATVMTPRPMDQVFFDRGTTDIKNADWIATADVVSTAGLKRLLTDSKLVGAPWNKKALEAAADLVEETSTINEYVLRRLRRTSLPDDTVLKKNRELLMYYGKLDTLNDGIEYVCALVNRKVLVRFHANNFQHGMRPFRVAFWQDFQGPLGLGLYKLFGHSHKSMDATMQRITDNLAMGSYNMWKRKKNSVSDEDLVIRPLQIVDVEEMNDIAPLEVPVDSANAGLKLLELMTAQYRLATGATDNLQGQITEATASEVSLAMNEALRHISVKTELAADGLMREHYDAAHANNGQFLKEPLNIATAFGPTWVYPSDLRYDVDFTLKLTTDKDFRPQRLEKLISLLQIVTSTKSNHPDQMQISILPMVKQIAQMLDVNPEDVVLPGAPPMMGGMMGAPDMAGLAQMMGPMAGPGGGPDVVQTPVGPTLASPQ